MNKLLDICNVCYSEVDKINTINLIVIQFHLWVIWFHVACISISINWIDVFRLLIYFDLYNWNNTVASTSTCFNVVCMKTATESSDVCAASVFGIDTASSGAEDTSHVFARVCKQVGDHRQLVWWSCPQENIVNLYTILNCLFCNRECEQTNHF